MEHEFNELDLEMVMNQPFRDFLQSIGYKDKVRHCVDGRYMVGLVTVTCTYNIQYAPPPNDLLAVVRQPHEKPLPELNLDGPKMILWVNKLARTSFDEAIRKILSNELELSDLWF